MKPLQKNLNLLLLLVLICFSQVSICTDCSGCTTTDGLTCSGSSCDTSICKPGYGFNQCYDCGSSPIEYYTITLVESNNVCQSLCQGDKIIGDTKECSDQTITTYEYQLGDVYFFSGTPDTNKLKQLSGKLYECKSYHIKKIINRKTVYTCYDPTTIASEITTSVTYYFDSTKGELLQTGCPNGLTKKKTMISPNSGATGPTIIRCSESCEGEEFYQKVSNGAINEESCINTCDGSFTSGYKYAYVDTGVKKCLNTCPPGTYIKDGSGPSSTCVTSDQCDFYKPSGNTCYDSCSASGSPKHNYGSKICIDSCTGEYAYENGNVCYKKEDCQFIDETSPKRCLPSCDSEKFHEYNSKSCIDNCNSNPINKFHASGGFVCYPSCASIPGNYIYEISDNKCITQTEKTGTNCPFYYIKIDGVRKCVSDTNDCVNAGYKYIDFPNKICKESCDDGNYQMEVQESSSGGTTIKAYVKCYEDIDKALDDTTNPIVAYYNIKTKQCWSSFPTGGDFYIKAESAPSSWKYEIVNECENFYYVKSDNSKYCIENCQSIPTPDSVLIYYEKGNKQCVQSCTVFNKYYFNPSTKECLDTCKGTTNFGFQDILVTSNHQGCLSSCDGTGREEKNQYYNYDSNICLNHCGADDNKKYHANGEKICYSSCAEIPDGEYIYEGYPGNDGVITFQKAKPTCSSNEYFYTKLNGVKKCTNINDCLESNKKYIVDGECKDSCDGNGHYLVERIHNASPLKKYYECYDSRESALNSITGSEEIYCDTKKYKCWIGKGNIPDEYYIGSPLTDDISPTKFEVVEECNNFYYIETSGSGSGSDPIINTKICIDNCKDKTLYFIKGNKQCIPDNKCLTEQKYYYDDSNNECLDTCKGRPLNKFQEALDPSPSLKKCLSSCPPTSDSLLKYYDYDSNECMGECNRNIGSKNKYRANDGTLCYPSCKDIPGNYIYEGIMKCTTDLTVCANANFKYIIHGENGECLESCNGYYTVENFKSTGTTPTRVSTGTYTCYSSLDNSALDPDGTGKLYCDSQTKRCLETLQSGYKIKSTIITNIYEVVSVCDYFYYTDGTEVKCTDKCQTVSKYFVDGNRECLSECATAPTSKYYYDPENKECLTTCIGQPFNKFQNKITGSTPTTAVSCLSSCSSGEYYDYDSNICISKCGEGTNDYKYHADGKFVCYPSCKEIPGEYIYEGVPDSTDNIIICYKTKDNSVCTYFYEKVNGIRICTTSLEKCYYANYKYIMENGECKDNCDGYYQLEHSFTPDGETVPLIVYKCYEKLVTLIGSFTLVTNEKLYCDKQIKKCWIKESLIDGYYIKSILPEASSSDNKFEIVKECPNFYYEDSTNGNTCIDSCKSTAPSLNYYFVNGNKQCISSLISCKNFNKYYYDPTTNECLDTCRGRIDHGF